MPDRVTPVHYLRPNHRSWSPRSVIFLDTETRTVHRDRTLCGRRAGDRDEHGMSLPPCPEDHVEALRLWVATFTDRKKPKSTTERHVSSWGITAASLALWIDTVTRNRESVWLYAHNLGFDLTTTRLPLWLVQRGWTISDAAIGGKAPWVRMSIGRRSVTMVDSWSWLPVALEAVGQAVRIAKPRLPANTDDASVWRSRCGADVDIMATAILDLMAWWDRNKLGNWTLTGTGCGWNAYRHRSPAQGVVVDPDPEKVAQDRLAVHGGRRGVWSLGAHHAGPFLELDFVAAYPTMLDQGVHPIGRAYAFDSKPLDDPTIGSDRWGMIARVRIKTDTPRWPVRIDGATWYPVGEFWADLAGPDIHEAAQLGALQEIGPGHMHKLGTHMADWAGWVLSVQNGTADDTPDVARIAAKAWSRSVIGKWAGRGYNKQALGPSPTNGWGYEEGWDHDKQCAGGMVDLAGQRWWITSDGTPDNAYPAIFGWVESAVRVRLGRTIAALGDGTVIQADTDGLIVAARTLGTRASGGSLIAPEHLSGQARWQWTIDAANRLCAPLTLRIKARHNHVHIDGPQRLTLDSQRRFAGLSRSALLGADNRYHARLWPTLQWQLANQSPAGYVRPLRSVRLGGPSPTGWVLSDNRVMPVETATTMDGQVRIVPWHSTRYAAAGMLRSDVQHRTLDGLI